MVVFARDHRHVTAIPSIARPRPFADFSALALPLWKAFRLKPREASFAVRGFSPANPAKRAHLETIGLTFISGYNAALDARDAQDVRIFVDAVEREFRGFAAEGAAMGAAIRSAMSLSTAFLQAVVQALKPDFDYLAHVGVGWATARVPWRARRHRALLDPIHHWLADDGRGFHDCFFQHQKVLAGRGRIPCGYAAGSYAQGVGRALWFVAGAEIAGAAALVAALPPERHGDLWSGLGLAMTYAGPADADTLVQALAAAGPYRSAFAQGVAFACEARARAGHLPAVTALAVRAVWDMEAAALAALVREARAQLPGVEGEVPRYELWRRRVAASFAAGTGGAGGRS